MVFENRQHACCHLDIPKPELGCKWMPKRTCTDADVEDQSISFCEGPVCAGKRHREAGSEDDDEAGPSKRLRSGVSVSSFSKLLSDALQP